MPKQEAVAEITPETVAPPKQSSSAALVEIRDRGIVLRSLDDLLRFARLAVENNVAPKGMSYGAAAISIQAGLEVGLGLLGGLRHGVVINGVFSWRGQGAVALIQNSPVCKPGSLHFGVEGEGENMHGWAEAWRAGYPKPKREEFSVKDAKQARLWGQGDNWTKYPKRMLQWRALGLLARDLFPDVLGGFPLAEEAEDFEPINVTPQQRRERLEPPKPSGPDPLLAALNVTPKESAEKEPVPEEKSGPAIDEEAGEPQKAEATTCPHGNLNGDFCRQCSAELDAELAEERA